MNLLFSQNDLRLPAIVASGLALSACGGGGGGGGGEPTVVDPSAYTEIADRDSDDDTILVFLGTTNAGALRRGTAGTLDHNNNTITSGLLTGTTNNERTIVMMNGGGVATLTNPTGADYMRVFSVEGAGVPIFGVVGQQTGPSGIPDQGTTQYNGQISLTIADGSDLASLTGDASFTASWADGGSMDATFDSFQENGSNVGGEIEITGADINNSNFKGGSLSTSGNLFDVTGAADFSDTLGYFFGPDAAEVGGTLIIDDTANGSLKIVGVFSAD